MNGVLSQKIVDELEILLKFCVKAERDVWVQSLHPVSPSFIDCHAVPLHKVSDVLRNVVVTPVFKSTQSFILVSFNLILLEDVL